MFPLLDRQVQLTELELTGQKLLLMKLLIKFLHRLMYLVLGNYNCMSIGLLFVLLILLILILLLSVLSKLLILLLSIASKKLTIDFSEISVD